MLKGAGIILVINGPDPKSLEGAEKGALLVGALDPARRRDTIDAYAAAGLEALAMEWMPRITRAQSMDIFSSQSNLAGYKAVVEAADAYGRAFPMMMTAAGTVSPAKAFVMGVGVAGLQAIATARRLGAQVSATDVRSATREQIQSLGAKPIFVEDVAGIEGEGAGGYATEMSAEYQKAQAELVSGHIAKQDIVITTALIPGKPAPRLISDAQVATMRPGSVIVDLAADAGGNVEGTVSGESGREAWRDDHRRIQPRAQPRRRLLGPVRAQPLQFPGAFWDKEQGRPVLPDDDEIVKAIRLTPRRQGRARAADRRLTRWRTADILVIGGGIAGLSAAAALSRRMRGSPCSRPRSRSASTRRAEARPCSIMRSATGWSAR